jgi:hypothetical protein
VVPQSVRVRRLALMRQTKEVKQLNNVKALEISYFFLEFEIRMILQGRFNVAQFARKKQQHFWKLHARGGKLNGAS